MAYDSAAMRRRFLDAAFEEFVQYGLAGARVDRIAAKAGASKQAIYSYFGSKEGLFDAVLTQRHLEMIEAVPLTPEDLPSYAGAIYDYLTAHPGYARLTMWRRLERQDASAADIEAYRTKLGQLQEVIAVDTSKWGVIDVILLVLASANAWESVAPAIRGLDPDAKDDADRRVRERRALVASVAASVAALSE
ncbi:TetR/AcrR family transcriptional regulator [Actinacidiphila acididurans]|uniref:TetR family transcriptional regulator n=1 Tax=Actinacidiphila acididurans TaxID=2784346 RepID=A0ABS2TV31_9ACTN|nr:TetR family transcriptional regulator [Actinacidiphila acididurans]MBM9506150.1 TetR family transcriptional regulator [Actinacidiphila acididurans]